MNLTPAPYVTIQVASLITGLTEKAIRRKMETGKWIEGREWLRSPDGGIFISIKGFQQWVEQGSRPAPGQSASRSRSTVANANTP